MPRERVSKYRKERLCRQIAKSVECYGNSHDVDYIYKHEQAQNKVISNVMDR